MSDDIDAYFGFTPEQGAVLDAMLSGLPPVTPEQMEAVAAIAVEVRLRKVREAIAQT